MPRKEVQSFFSPFKENYVNRKSGANKSVTSYLCISPMLFCQPLCKKAVTTGLHQSFILHSVPNLDCTTPYILISIQVENSQITATFFRLQAKQMLSDGLTHLVLHPKFVVCDMLYDS
jgi:hypothetical protein